MFDPSFNPMYYPVYNNTIEQDPYYNYRATIYNPFEIKHRRRTSRAQLKVLENSFEENTKPNATVRRILAQQLDMTPRGVQIWFQNRRAKAKLQKKKQGNTDARLVATTAAASCFDWLNMPIHPLAPVIEDGTSELMNAEDWRRKSCPSLQETAVLSWPLPIDDRRMTADDIFQSSSECSTPQWTKDMYTPILTPMLSTGSPVSSVDNAYCLDLLPHHSA